MKELQLLPEDWEGHIDYTAADVLLVRDDIYLRHEDNYVRDAEPFPAFRDHQGEVLPHSEFSRVTAAYVTDGLGLAELKPALRPDDSIKLSECDYRHILTATAEKGYFRRILLENGMWAARNDRAINIIIDRSLIELLKHCGYEDIKVFEMQCARTLTDNERATILGARNDCELKA